MFVDGGARFSLAPWHWRSLFRLRRAILRAQRQQDLDADSPPAVILTDLSAYVLTQARMLVANGREDDDAVRELIKFVDGDVGALRIAALGARQGGEHHESSGANLTHRLLQAAIVDASVVPLTDKEYARLTLLDDFAELPVVDQWRRLTELLPCLSDLCRKLGGGQLARHLKSSEVAELPLVEREQIMDARRAVRERLKKELMPLIGPRSLTDNTILRSQIAFDAALIYLIEVGDDFCDPKRSGERD